MKKAEQFVRRLIVQLFSCVRIDMAHHQINVFLFQRIKDVPCGKIRRIISWVTSQLPF